MLWKQGQFFGGIGKIHGNKKNKNHICKTECFRDNKLKIPEILN